MAARVTRIDCGGSILVDETDDMLWNDSEEVECEEDKDSDCEMKTVILIGKGT